MEEYIWRIKFKSNSGTNYTVYYQSPRANDAFTQFLHDHTQSMVLAPKEVTDAAKKIYLNRGQGAKNYFEISFDQGEGEWAELKKNISLVEHPAATKIKDPNKITDQETKNQQDAESKKEEAQNAGITIPNKEDKTDTKQPQPTEKYPSWFTDEGELLDWKSRWQLAKLKKIELEQRDMLKQQERRPDAINLEKRYKEKEAAWDKVNEGNVFALGEAILKELGFGIQYLGTHLSYIPRDMRDGMNMMTADLTIVGLTIERILDIIGKMWSIVAKLDGIGAFDLIEKYTKNINNSLEKGIKAGILEKDGTLKPGWERFAVPGVTGTNSAEEIRQWMAVKELMRVPFLGSGIQTTLETQMLLNYENRTGVGIPDEDAWIRWILGNSGAYMPIQQATEIAGSIPDWFLIGKATQITREIHAAEHRELQRQKEDFRARNEAQRARINKIKPHWAK